MHCFKSILFIYRVGVFVHGVSICSVGFIYRVACLRTWCLHLYVYVNIARKCCTFIYSPGVWQGGLKDNAFRSLYISMEFFTTPGDGY